MEFTAPAYLLMSSLVCGLVFCGSLHAPLRTIGLLMLLPPTLWGVVTVVLP
jgi:hypothetical protein